MVLLLLQQGLKLVGLIGTEVGNRGGESRHICCKKIKVVELMMVVEFKGWGIKSEKLGPFIYVRVHSLNGKNHTAHLYIY